MNVYVPAASSVLRINTQNNEIFISEPKHFPNLRRRHIAHLFLLDDTFSVDIHIEVQKFIRNRLISIVHTRSLDSELESDNKVLAIKFCSIFVPSYIPDSYMQHREFPTYIPLINFAMVHVGSGNLLSVASALINLRSPFTLINALVHEAMPKSPTQHGETTQQGDSNE